MRNELTLSETGFFVLRTPLSPIKTWTENRVTHGHGTVPDDEIWDRRGASARAMFADSEIREAIYIASRNLFTRLSASKWEMRNDADRKLLMAFERYLNRMCFRSTPFGLFATFSTGKISSEHSSLLSQFGSTGPVRREVRVDYSFLSSLSTTIGTNQTSGSRFITNRSLYRKADTLRYIEWRDVGKDRNYLATEIQSHAVIETALALCAGTACQRHELALEVLNRHADYSLEVVEELIADLIDAQVLLPEERVDLFADDSVLSLAARVLTHGTASETAEKLIAIAESMKITSASATENIETYHNLEARLRDLLPGDLSAVQTLRMDAFRDKPELALDATLVERTLAVLGQFISRFSQENQSAGTFATAFSEVYGTGSVPLVMALDQTAMSDLDDKSSNNQHLQRLNIAQHGAGRAEHLSPNKFERFLITKLLHLDAHSGDHTLRLTSEDLAHLTPKSGTYPPRMFAILTLLPTETDMPQRVWVQGLGNFDAAAWLGRFGYGSPALQTFLRDSADEIVAADTDVLHAEISYLPSSEMGNVMTRPLIWPYRISLVEGNASSNEIPLSDIMVSVKKGRVEIWSSSRKKRIIPHMTCAHNVHHPGNIKAYSFLRQIESHGQRFTQSYWGSFFADYPYVPRIELDELVLAPARWIVNWSDFTKSAPQVDSMALRSFLADRKVPAVLELKEIDNTLILDLDDPIDREQILKIFRSTRRMQLREVLTGSAKNIDYPGARHEIILPFRVDQEAKSATSEAKDIAVKPMHALVPDMVRTPMLETIFVKIYLPGVNANGVLLQIFHDWLAENTSSGEIAHWFFIRYADPHPHLRLRIFPRDEKAYAALMAGVVRKLDALVMTGQIDRFTFVEYQRELVRYGGGELMPLNERLFFIDSEIAVRILEHFAPVTEQRWMGPAWAIHALLGDLGIDLTEKYEIMSELAASFKREFRISGRQIKLLGQDYRRHAKGLEALLDIDGDWMIPGTAIADESTALRQLRRKLIADAAVLLQDAAPDIFRSIVQSQIHMLCNRLVDGNARPHELYVYDMMERWYRSCLGRQRRPVMPRAA